MNKKFKNIILICQKLREEYPVDYEEKCKKQIDALSNKIIEEHLLPRGEDENFAKQLCMMNGLRYE